MAFAGPAEIAREALSMQSVWFDRTSGALTIIASDGGSVSKNQLAFAIVLGYCDSILGDYPEMNAVKTVKVVNRAETHGYVFFGGAKACEDMDPELDDEALGDAILAHTSSYRG